ncbi:MAG TPA: N-acetyltransferase [Rhodanobacteraceae bacterium]|nr:N-acetyltransferase [Rhodanobacteraceae bacterium]
MPTRIRPAQPFESQALYELHRAAFGRLDEAELVASLRAAHRSAYELAAEREGSIVGHILFSPVLVERGDDGLAVGLAPLAVAPEHQRQGVGSALVQAALMTLKTGPYRMVVVLGDPAYYQRFGFRAAGTFGLHDTFGGGDAFMALALKPTGLAGYGGQVDYAPEFDRLA